MSAFEKLCNEYRENKRLIEELKVMNDSIKTDIIAIMGDRETVIEGSSKATYKAVISPRFDSSSFRKVHPDLFSEYSRKTSYTRFCVLLRGFLSWFIPFAEYMRRFWVKTKHYGIIEMYALNKADVRKELKSNVIEIIEVKKN